MAQGYLALVLHTHLPFVRHPEYARPMEERWLHEALTECYLPILDMFARLDTDSVPFALTMSLTPPLAAMLRDDLLRDRYNDHLSRLESLTEREVNRLREDPYLGPVARFYQYHLSRVRSAWERIGRDVVGALAHYYDSGKVDLITCSATHAYLPGLLPCREALRAQLRLGAAAFRHIVGRVPHGMWLPECAYDPSFDNDIANAGIRYTILDTHGLMRANPRPPFGVYHPIISHSGVAFFARDEASSRQVWSREMGYPGNPFYRDFYRDIGFDLPEDMLQGEVGPFGNRMMTGIKYYRITGQTDDKLPYQPGVAAERAWVDAGNFLSNREAQVRDLSASMPVPPIVVAPYDSELFGHWWFEGPLFLEALFRQAHSAYESHKIVLPITLRSYLTQHPVAFLSTPAASSWGAGGHGEVWVGPAAARFWRHIHHASRYIQHLTDSYSWVEGVRGRALDLAIRELLLLQTSDWPFILKTGSVGPYAEARIRAHTHRLRHLGWMVQSGTITEQDEQWLRDIDSRDNFLSSMDSETLRNAYRN